jgi:hypothetical protein
MATTTNYGWTTPNDTDLVKDGASAIRSLGTAIDTTVFNNAGAAIAKTIVDAKGDIIAATAADTVSRLAVGANDTVLTADSSTATGLKWAAPVSGGMTLLNSGGTTLSGSTTTISFTSTGYTALRIYIKGAFCTAATNAVNMRINGDTGSNYSYAHTRNGGSVNSVSATSNYYIFNSLPTSASDSKLVGNAQIDMFFPTDTDFITTVWSSIGGASDSFYFSTGVSTYDCSAAVSSVSFIMSSGNFSGGTAYVYGVK